MASTLSTITDSLVSSRHTEHIHKYHWPAVQLNLWMLVMLVASSTIVGIFATFIDIQNNLLLGVPWYFPYFITVGSLGILFVILLLWLIYQRQLLPSIVMIGGFTMFVLWMVGLVVVSIELWGPSGSINSTCNLVIFSQHPQGQTLETLAWLQQRSVCQSWLAVFALGLVGAVFLLWIMIMAYSVFADG